MPGFISRMVLVSAAIIFVGFSPSFYLKSVIHAPPPLTQLTIAHGLVFTAWILLFITQASLISRKQHALHRQLGILGAILYGAVASLGLSTAITAGRLGHAPPEAPPPLAFMALSLFIIVAALALVVIALWNRRRSDWHKRLMLASLFMMTGPGTGRIAIPLGIVAQEVTWVSSSLSCSWPWRYCTTIGVTNTCTRPTGSRQAFSLSRTWA